MDSTEHTTYLSNIKDVSARIMILIDVNNGLRLMAGDIGNAFCKAPCDENIWSFCGTEFGPISGAVVVLK